MNDNSHCMGKTALVIGLGRMGMRHVQALQSTGMATVLGWDPRAEAEEVAKNAGVVWLEKIEDAARSNPQLAVIASTAPAHLENLRSIAALQTVRAVLCEKPMACSLAECDGMIALAAQENIRLGVNFYRRYSEPYLALKEMSDAGRVMGRFVSMLVTCGAGGMACNGIHYLDLARWFFGCEARAVSAFYRDLKLPVTRGTAFEDPGLYAEVHFAGGQRLYLDFSDDFGLGQRVEICAPHGRVLIDEETGVIEAQHRPEETRPATLRHYGSPLKPWDFPDKHPDQIITPAAAATRNLLDEDTPIASTAGDGRHAVELYVAMRLSADRGGGLVPLPLPSGQHGDYYPIT